MYQKFQEYKATIFDLNFVIYYSKYHFLNKSSFHDRTKLMKKLYLSLILSAVMLTTACNAGTNSEQTTISSESENEYFESLMNDTTGELPDQESLDLLKNQTTAVSEDLFSGKWQRTECESSVYATVNISQNDDKTVTVKGLFYDYGNVGSINNATGYYVSNSEMFVIDEEYATLYLFKLSDNLMTIVQLGAGNMGEDVTANGTYTTGDPVYTNDNVLENNFTEEELSSIKQLLEDSGLDYLDFFENTVLYGKLTVTKAPATFEDGSTKEGTWYEAVSPHGYTYDSYTFISEDGEIYFSSTANDVEEYLFLTTDDSVTDMPVK